MRTVKEVSKLSGVSVRTLHHYDAIGLLKPSAVTDAGYRLYDDIAVSRLQTILMFRELDFPLKEIKTILESNDFDLKTALKQHIRLLELQKEHIDKLVSLANKMIDKGVNTMDFSAFDKSKIEDYAKEVKERWGNTAAYKESTKKMAAMTAEQQRSVADGLMQQFVVFGKLKDRPADSEEVQNAVLGLQQYISDHYYTCSGQILAGLGEMYTEDERFRSNIDAVGGTETAEFVGQAIKIYCR